MAKVINQNYQKKKNTKRPGIHSKNKTSSLKTSRNYVKTYKGQGR